MCVGPNANLAKPYTRGAEIKSPKKGLKIHPEHVEGPQEFRVVKIKDRGD